MFLQTTCHENKKNSPERIDKMVVLKTLINSSRNFKKREREAGQAIETVAKVSCMAFTEKERQLSAESPKENNEVVEVGVSYDMGWRKRGKSYDSSSGVGTAVGLNTGKVISYSTRNTMCRIC